MRFRYDPATILWNFGYELKKYFAERREKCGEENVEFPKVSRIFIESCEEIKFYYNSTFSRYSIKLSVDITVGDATKCWTFFNRLPKRVKYLQFFSSRIKSNIEKVVGYINQIYMYLPFNSKSSLRKAKLHSRVS